MRTSQYRIVVAIGFCFVTAICSQYAFAGESASPMCAEQEARQMTQPQQVVDACNKALSAANLSGQQISQYLIQRARGYEALGESAPALADLARAVSLDPNSYLALDARAQYFDAAGDLIQAKRDGDAAFELAPEAPERYAAKGAIYAAAFDPKTAIDIYSEGIRRYPDAWVLYLDRGSAYHSVGDHERAMQDLDTAGRLAPGEYRVNAARGQLYMDEKQPLLAIKEYDLAMTKTTDGGPVLLGRCQAELMVGRPQKAIKDCSGALDAIPGTRVGVLLYRGFAYLDAGRFAEARKDFEAELSLAPGVFPARYGRALADYGSGIPKARTELATMLKDDPAWRCDIQERFGAKPPSFWHPPEPRVCEAPAVATSPSP